MTDSAVDSELESTPPSEPASAVTQSTVTQSTYELLVSRLRSAAAELADRANGLNQKRLDAFQSGELKLVGTERVRTENNVVPRDVAAVDDQLILAYNAVAGVRSEIRPEDVFSVHHLDETSDKLILSPNPDGLAGSPFDNGDFSRDFDEVHTYFKQARIQQVYQAGQKLLAVFRTGDGVADLKVLRWAIHPDGELLYLDARGERDHRFPSHQDAEWIPTERADHVVDRFIAAGERVLVSPLGGTLSLLLSDGETVLLEESVEQADQALQDCEVEYAEAGDLVIVRVTPYREDVRRHYVVNLLARTATRVDALEQAFRHLPENQGLIFPEGIYLRTGEVRTFDLDASDMELLEVVRSPNGEDVLYVFHHKEDGRSILLPYNVVRQEVAVPIWCHGHCLFPDGKMIIFREEAEPTRVHPIQIWTTPFCSDEWYSELDHDAGPLDRIGNAALVAGIADALALQRLVTHLEPSSEVYGDLLGSAGRTLDTHHWFDADEVGNLAEPINDIRGIAEQVLDEFEQVQQVRQSAAQTLAEATEELETFTRELRIKPPTATESFIEQLRVCRTIIGHLHSVKDVREMDVAAVDALLETAAEVRQTLAQDAAEYLAEPDAFAAYHTELSAISEQTALAESSAQAADTLTKIDEVAEAMDTVADVAGDLVVDDPRVRTSVLEQVSQVLAALNRARATAKSRQDELVQSETSASFATELGLFSQTINTVLSRAGTPELCDDGLARLLVTLEQLETSGPRSDAQLEEITTRRENVVEAFNTRRQQLIDAAQQRADRLTVAAERTLERVGDRAVQLESIDEIHGFFAADPLIERVRQTIKQLREMDEPVRADELQARLGSARDAAIRSLRDRLELFDGDAVALGQHRFSVDDRNRELTVVPNDGQLEAVLTGTDLRIKIENETLTQFQHLWDQPVLSESAVLYRSAFLAANILRAGLQGDPEACAFLDHELEPDDARLTSCIQRWVGERLDENYDRGVHDVDAAQIVAALGGQAADLGTLLHPGSVRAEGRWAWSLAEETQRDRWKRRGQAAALLQQNSDGSDGQQAPDRELSADLSTQLASEFSVDEEVARYLVAELCQPGDFTFSRSASIDAHLRRLGQQPVLAQILGNTNSSEVATDLRPIIADYVRRDLVNTAGSQDEAGSSKVGLVEVDQNVVDELTVGLLTSDHPVTICETDVGFSVTGLAGQHPTVRSRTLTGKIDELFAIATEHGTNVMAQHRAFNAARHKTIDSVRSELRLSDLEPSVPEGFVRNRLLDQLYLPLIGDNLARQIGTVDDQAAARSGLLLLLSPPGYGKTTLVEYVAERLGMALVKVSGPALGHDVTTLDPAQAPNATAAREIERINVSFAIGSNVILYLDDIQHTSPELLQRFISLCDGQRRVDGVWDNNATMFDLRGKRFAVVMAGNPYTESGERFQIPDMLANRADIYNLGDVLAGHEDVFAYSYIENALTANPVLAPLAGRDRRDVEIFVAAADGQPLEESGLQHRYGSAEQREIVAVLRHVRRVQRVVLAVNRQYIASAATEDAYRTEPPFLLQGSYRNMARMTSKLLPVMTDAEVNTVIDEHYVAESQALTGAAESNLLKLAELRDAMSEEQRQRWLEICETFGRQQRLGGDERDPTTRVVAAISEIASELNTIRTGSESRT